MRFAILFAFLFACSSCWTIYREVPAKPPAKAVSTPATVAASPASAPGSSASTPAGSASPVASVVSTTPFKMRVGLSQYLKETNTDYQVDLHLYEITGQSHIDLSTASLQLSGNVQHPIAYTLKKIKLQSISERPDRINQWEEPSYPSLTETTGIDLIPGKRYMLIYFFSRPKDVPRSRHFQVSLSVHTGNETITRTIQYKKGKEVELLH